MLISHVCAHLALHHSLFSTRYRFVDAPTSELLDMLDPQPFQEDEAEKKQLELLAKSRYSQALSQAGLYLDGINEMAARLPALISHNTLDHLGDGGQILRNSRLMRGRVVYDPKRDGKFSALALGSRMSIDRATNKVDLLGAPLVPLRGKSFVVMPFYPPAISVGGDSADSTGESAKRVPPRPPSN
jgi:hypothetical protein